MFDGIADRYDFLNRLVSLGLDGRWQRRLKSKRQLFSPAKGLYIAVPPEYRSWGVISAEQTIDRLMAHLHRQYLRLAAHCSGAAPRGAPCAIEEALGRTPAAFDFVMSELVAK